MDQDPQAFSNQSLDFAPGVDTRALQQWHSEYLAMDANPGGDDDLPPVIIVDLDSIDPTYVEDLIRQAELTTYVSGGFCNRCFQLFGNWPELGNDKYAGVVWGSCHTAEIEAATRQGCRFCSFLLQGLRQHKDLDRFRKIERRLAYLNDKSSASISMARYHEEILTLWLNFPGKTTTRPFSCHARARFLSIEVAPSCYKEHRKGQLQIATQWLGSCSESHECLDVEALERPPRLLYIADDAIKLILTSNLVHLPEYATLSYCWGHNQFLTLTTDNIDTFLRGISIQSLPQCFKDAILITRKLGLQLIWIDALCIIQAGDDNRDWLIQSGMMRSIYGGSYLNIAAASATSAHSSLFSMRRDYCGGVTARTESREDARVRIFFPLSVYEEFTIDSHLASRAWALQERLLAPRTIYVGDHGFFWECRSEMTSEFLPKVSPYRFSQQLVRHTDQPWNWQEIISTFSQASLTYQSDKLPALAGIARRQHEVTGDVYLAGMWKADLEEQLVWTSAGNKINSDWRAPSWSWASVDGRVQYWDEYDDLRQETCNYVETLNAGTSPAGPDPFGAVKDAELQVACFALICGHYRTIGEASSGSILTSEGERHFPISIDNADDPGLKTGDPILFLPIYTRAYGRHAGALKEELWYASRVGTNNSTEDGADDEEESEDFAMSHRGIILQRHGLEKGVFRRIAAFQIQDEEDENSAERMQIFSELMIERGWSTAEDECIRVRPDDGSMRARYVIALV